MGVYLFISDPFTFGISIFGIVVSILYICHQLCRSVKRPNYDEDLKKALFEWLNKNEESLDKKLSIITKDYETANSELGRRDNITLLVGTILVSASLLILGNTVRERPQNSIGIYAFASIGLFLVFLFVLHDTAKRLNGLSYDRIQAIEQALTCYFNLNHSKKGEGIGYNFGIHSYIHTKTKDQNEWWLRLRRTFWADVLLLLSLSWMLLATT